MYLNNLYNCFKKVEALLLFIARFKGKASYISFLTPRKPSKSSKNMYQLGANPKNKRDSSNWITFEESKRRGNVIVDCLIKLTT